MDLDGVRGLIGSPSKFSRSPMEQIDLKIHVHVHVALYAQNVKGLKINLPIGPTVQ